MMTDLKTWLARKPAGPKPRRRIPRVSKKRAKEGREYAAKRKAFLKRHIFCQAQPIIARVHPDGSWGEPLPVHDLHHIRGRGRYFLDEMTWLAMSRRAHTWIHDHPKWARTLGLLI